MVSGRVVMGSPGQSRPRSNRTGSSGISLMMRGQSPAVVETLTSAAVISRPQEHKKPGDFWFPRAWPRMVGHARVTVPPETKRAGTGLHSAWPDGYGGSIWRLERMGHTPS